ncbi:MAG: hypothetical protein JO161_08385 [Planctomycetaceae bacterium]|nr:hypothetical protein [Planctomycetaceae bacterium]
MGQIDVVWITPEPNIDEASGNSGRLEQKMLVWVNRLEIGDPVVIELNCLEEIDAHVATSQTDPMRRTQGRNRIARDDASAVTILPAKNAILSRR